MSNSLILTTTQSFLRAVENSELKKEIEQAGFSVVFADSLQLPFFFAPEEIFAIVAGEPEISADAVHCFPNLKIIARFGRGLDAIDVITAKAKRIAVTSVPWGSTRSVAEHAVGLMFALARNISQLDALVKQGKWERMMG